MLQTTASPIVSLEPPHQGASRESIESSVLRRLGTISSLMDSLVASWHCPRQVLHARRWHRFRFERPIAVTLLDPHDLPDGEPLLAAGRDISKGGISFTHCRPLSCRRVAVTLRLDDGACETILTELLWCRFTREGIYQSGGVFVRKIDLPSTTERNWDELAHA